MEIAPLAKFDYKSDGYFAQQGSDGKSSSLGIGSRNAFPIGAGRWLPYKGMGASVAAGSRVLFNVKSTYAGLSDIAPSTTAGGSVFAYIGNSIWYIGAGQLTLTGTNISGAIASSSLQFLLARNGSYTATESGPYVAGLNQSSSPTFQVSTTTSTLMDGVYSIKVSRYRSTTGAISVASPTSVALEIRGFKALVTLPFIALGQTHWYFYCSEKGFGGVGPHFRNRSLDILETAIEKTVTGCSGTSGGASFLAPTGQFTSADIGKRVSGTGALTFTAAAVISSITTASPNDTINLTGGTVNSAGTQSGSVKGIAYAGGIDRTIEIEWADGDLDSEFAPTIDFAPPAGTHAFGIENIVAVGGCFSDATANPTIGSAGTCINISEKNKPESYDPRKLLYLPEGLIDVIGRPSDSYVYAGCLTSVHAIQYTGDDSGPACAIMTIWPTNGIAHRHNWTLGLGGELFAYIAKMGPVRMGDKGQPDNTFATPVLFEMAEWDQANTIVAYYPDRDCILYAHSSGFAFAYSINSQQWSGRMYFKDFQAGAPLSAVTVSGRAYMTLNNAGTHTLYDFDNGAGSTVTAMSQFYDMADGSYKNLQRCSGQIRTDKATTIVYQSLHRNTSQVLLNDVSITSGSNLLNSTAEAQFDSTWLGMHVLVYGAGASGAPLFARIKAVNSLTQVQLCVTTGPRASAAALNASTAVTNGSSLIARQIIQRTLTGKRDHTLQELECNLREASNFAVGLTFQSEGVNAQASWSLVKGVIDTVPVGPLKK